MDERAWPGRVVMWGLLALLCALPLLTLVSRNDRGRWEMNRCAMASPDEPSYLLMALSIARGDGISTVAIAGRDTFYPPGLPLVLAGWGKVFGFSIQSMHVCVALTLSAAVGMAYVLARRMLALWRWQRPGWAALAVTALFAANYHVLDDGIFVFSEPLFMLLTFAWLYAALRLPRWWQRPDLAAVVTLLAAGATMARAAGMVCFVATLGFVAFQAIWRGVTTDGKQRLPRRLATVGAVLAVILAYYVTLHMLSPEKSIASGAASDNSYVKQLVRGVGIGLDTDGKLATPAYRLDVHVPAVFKAVKQLVWEHLQDFARVMVPPYRDPDEQERADLYSNITRLFLLLAALGWSLRMIGRGPSRTRMVEIYVLLYIGLMMIWPFRMVRFWIPLLPMLWVYVLDALRWDFMDVRARAWAARLHMGIAGLLVALLLVLSGQEIYLKFNGWKQRLNYVSDCLAHSARVVGARSVLPAKTTLCVPGADEQYLMAWYLQSEGVAGSRVMAPGYVQGGRRVNERIEAMILRALQQAGEDPANRVFVFSYFAHDPTTGGEPTMLLVLRNLQKENPGMFVPSDPNQLGFAPLAPGQRGQWKIVKRQHLWNTTAVWELVRER